MQYKIVSQSEEWKLWNGAFKSIAPPGQMSIKLFPCNGELVSEDLAQHIRAGGQPDILWVEGSDYPPYIRQIIELCSQSFKIVYSKNYKPWKVDRLDLYDLCLVDEAWQAERVKKVCPKIHCSVWDKLIDYENTHHPLPVEKVYDICYIAHLREGKNHALLFHAMAKLKNRKPVCVCVGHDRRGNREELERLAAELRLSVHFTGEVAKDEVNRYINQSKIGVMCSEADGVPRAMLEYMAANVPVLVNSSLYAGARYVGPEAGLVKSPEEFHLGLAELLDTYRNYSPRAYYLEHYSFEKVMAKFIGILQDAGFKGVVD
jgi:glycosyltransferase involved in cell wall biosynthesis